jgi:hypothetical protein
MIAQAGNEKPNACANLEETATRDHTLAWSEVGSSGGESLTSPKNGREWWDSG